MSDRPPSTNRGNGAAHRDARGRFAVGNLGGPGNPSVRQVGEWRKALVDSVTPADVRAVVLLLVKEARAGQEWAVRELLNRCLGRAVLPVEMDVETTSAVPADYLAFLDWKAGQVE